MVYPLTFSATDTPHRKSNRKVWVVASGKLLFPAASTSNHTITDYMYHLMFFLLLLSRFHLFCWFHVNLYKNFCNSICMNCCSMLTACSTYKLNIKKYIICCIIQYEVAIGYISIQYATCNFHLFPFLLAHQTHQKSFPGSCGRVCLCVPVRVIKRAHSDTRLACCMASHLLSAT